MYRFKIGKANLGYNFSDARELEKWEQAFTVFEAAQGDLPKDAAGRAQIRYVCGTVFDLFDTIFGGGTAEKVFGDSCDLEICVEAVGQLIDARNAADEKASARIQAMAAKYSPKK